MFGSQDDQPSGQNTNTIPDESIQGALTDDSSTPIDQPNQPTGADDANSFLVSAPDPAPAAPATTDADQTWQHPGLPVDNSPEPISDIIIPGGSSPTTNQPPTPPFPGPPPVPVTPPPTPPFTHTPSATSDDAPNDLIDIKQKALSELSPLVDQLDQPPEDKFRTLMMMIQASDDQDLVKSAYEAAHSIEDEKTRAQALLDIVNEINYFTQAPPSQE